MCVAPSAPTYSRFARVVSKWVLLGNYVARLQYGAEENALGSPTLVGGDDVFEPGDLLQRALEAIERARSGVRLIALHHGRPLGGRQRTRSGIGQQIDEYILGLQKEQVVVNLA